MAHEKNVASINIRAGSDRILATLGVYKIGPKTCRWKITLREPRGNTRIEYQEDITNPREEVENICEVHLGQTPPPTRFKFSRHPLNNWLEFEFTIKLKNSRNTKTQLAVINSFVQTFMDATRLNRI